MCKIIEMEMRSLDKISQFEDEFFKKVWYNRYAIREEKIQMGMIRVVPDDYTLKTSENGMIIPENVIHRTILETARRNAREIELLYGVENLRWDDFEWGMVNGKLSALRWVLGNEWDWLDT